MTTSTPNNQPPHPPHPTDPGEFKLAHPHPRRSVGGEVVAWVVILAATLYIAGTHFIDAYFPALPATRATADQVDSFELVATRYLVGTKEVLPDNMTGGAFGDAARGNYEPYLQPESSEFDRIRAIMALGEMLGPDDALKELDKLEADAEARAEQEQADKEREAATAQQPDDEPDPNAEISADTNTPEITPYEDPETAQDIRRLRTIYTEGAGGALAQDDRDALIKRHGWFGKLAVSHNEPETDPLRKEIASGSIRTMIAFFAFGSVALLALLAGIVLFIIAMVMLKNRRIKFALPADLARVSDPRITPYLTIFAWFFVLFMGLSLVAGFIPPIGDIKVGQFILWGALLAAMWPMVVGTSWHDLRRSIGWHSGRGVLREMGAGVLGYITLLPIAGLGILVVLALGVIGARFGLSPQSHPAAEQISADPKIAIPLYLLACVWAPIVEETMFRGAFYRYLRGWTRPVFAALIQGLFFAIIHPQGILGVPALMALGFNFALIREWRGSLIAPMTAHALNNGFVFTMLLVAMG